MQTPTVQLYGMPLDSNSSYLKGAALAPSAIRKALYSDSSNGYSELGIDVLGHAHFMDQGDIAADFDSFTQAVTNALQQGNKTCLLGGDHSITYPVIKAYQAFYPNLTLLHIDAHPDLYDQFDNNPYSHACPFARIMEQGLVKRLIQVGIRTLNDHLLAQAQRFSVEIITMEQLDQLNHLQLSGPLYLSLDIDGLDPAFAPGVSHPEPGGLSTRQVIDLIHSINVPIVGADIVEYNPTRDIHDLTAYVAAKCVKEVVGKMLMK